MRLNIYLKKPLTYKKAVIWYDMILKKTLPKFGMKISVISE